MTNKFKLNEVEPGEKKEFGPEDDYVHPNLKHKMPSDEKMEQIKALKAKMEALQAELEELRRQQEEKESAAYKARKDLKDLEEIDTKLIQVASLVQRDCGFVLSEMLRPGKRINRWLYRGVKEPYDSRLPKMFVGKPRDNRRPKDAQNETQESFDKVLEEAGFRALRRNSIFCSGKYDQASGYGDEVFLIFPKDGFSFTWSPLYSDLYSDLLSGLENKGMAALLHSSEWQRAKYDVINEIGLIQSVCSEWRYSCAGMGYGNQNGFPDYESFLNKIGYNPETGGDAISDELNKLAFRIYRNVELITKVMDKLNKECTEAIRQIKAHGNEEFESNTTLDQKLTRILQVCKRFDAIGLLTVVQKPMRFSKPHGGLEMVSADLIQAITDWHKYENEESLSPEEIIRGKMKFNQTNFKAALDSGNEICVSGEYYAISANYSDQLQKIFEPKQKWTDDDEELYSQLKQDDDDDDDEDDNGDNIKNPEKYAYNEEDGELGFKMYDNWGEDITDDLLKSIRENPFEDFKQGEIYVTDPNDPHGIVTIPDNQFDTLKNYQKAAQNGEL